jgi:hypothetical protein
MTYYNYGSYVIQNLATLETLTLSSSGLTYKNSTTTYIPWTTIGTGGGGGSVTDPLNVSSGNFSSIDSNLSTLNIGAVKATMINIGNSNTSVNVVSGIFNASCFMLYSGNKVNPLNTTCFLDTIPRSTGVTQLGIGVTNADEIYIGDGVSNKKVVISTRPNTNSEITIGNASSTISVGGKMSIPTWNNFLTQTVDSGVGNGELYIGWNQANIIHIGNPTSATPIRINGPIYSDTGYTPTVNTKLTVDGSAVASGTGIMTIKQGIGSWESQPESLQDPFSITSPSGGSGNLTMCMGLDTTYNYAYINCAMNNAVRPLVLSPRWGNVYIGRPADGFNTTNDINSGRNNDLFVSGAITSNVATVKTKLTVDGSGINAATNIMTIKQNTGDYNVVSDFVQDPFSITSPNSGTLSVNNSAYNNLSLGMGVDTTYNVAYINCAMGGSIRPIVIGGRGSGDTYIGYVPTDILKTPITTTGNLFVKGIVTSNGAVINGRVNIANKIRMKFGDDNDENNGVITANLFEPNALSIVGINGNSGARRIQMYGNLYMDGELTVGSGTNNSIITLSNAGTYIKSDQTISNLGGFSTTLYRIRFYINNTAIMLFQQQSSGNGVVQSRYTISTNSNIGDFAEMFEWEDGNPENDKRMGYTVVVNEQGFIRKATMDDNPNDIIGCVTATATVIGSAAGMDYNKKYLKDDFEQTLLDASGNAMINPDYDETIEYLPRDRRKEWGIIGLYGKLIVRNGSPINPKWRLIGTRQTAKIYLT